MSYQQPFQPGGPGGPQRPTSDGVRPAGPGLGGPFQRPGFTQGPPGQPSGLPASSQQAGPGPMSAAQLPRGPPGPQPGGFGGAAGQPGAPFSRPGLAVPARQGSAGSLQSLPDGMGRAASGPPAPGVLQPSLRPPGGPGFPGRPLGPPGAGYRPPGGPPGALPGMSRQASGGSASSAPGGYAPTGSHSQPPQLGPRPPGVPSSNGYSPAPSTPAMPPAFGGGPVPGPTQPGQSFPGRPLRHSSSLGSSSALPPSAQGGGFAGGPPPPLGGGQFSAPSAVPSFGLPRPGMPGPGARPPSFGAAPPGFDSGPNMGGAGMLGGTAQQRQLDPFEAVELGPAAPGQRDAANPLAFPRPIGDEPGAASLAPPPPNARNCPARFMRLTVNAFPTQQALRARFQLPFGAIIHPMAGPQDVPVLNMSSVGIMRCARCRTYVNPFSEWVDGGRRFKCNMCGQLNEVGADHYSPVGQDGRRADADTHPQLASGCVEFIAPQEYMVRAPMPPAYMFVIDVSVSSVSSGLLAATVEGIRGALDALSENERTMVGFLTFDSTLHFYNLKASLAQPQMLVVAELSEPFAPLPDDLLVNLKESRPVVDALLESLPSAFSHTGVVDSAMGPALQAAFMVMTPLGGKLLLFQAAVPSLGVGRVKPRDNASVWGTDNEAKVRNPEDVFFKKFAAECSRVQIAIDVFSCCAQNTDVASLAALPKYTCGHLYYHPRFIGQRDAPKLRAELHRNLTRPTGWEAVMRIRTSRGLRVSAFHGHFFVRSSDLLALPQVDPDKAFAIQIAHEESVLTTPTAYVQCALLFTSSSGERRIRVHTLEAPVVAEMADLYRAIDGGACAALLAKLAVEKSFSDKMDETRNAFQHKVVLALREYRAVHSAQSRGSQPIPHNALIFPPALRLLPIWALGALKTAALRGTVRDVPTDERISVGFDVISAGVPALLRMAYPALMPVHDPSGDWGRPGPDDSVLLPPSLPLAQDLIDPSGAYLLDSGRLLLMWLGRGVSPAFLAQVFGEHAASGPVNTAHLSVEPAQPGSQLSERINAVLRQLRSGRANYPSCFVVMQGTTPEQHVLPFFVEERAPGLPGYGDWLSQLHKAVLSKA